MLLPAILADSGLIQTRHNKKRLEERKRKRERESERERERERESENVKMDCKIFSLSLRNVIGLIT